MKQRRGGIPRWVLVCAACAAAAAFFFGLQAMAAGDDWQPVSPADLALKDNPAQPGADAMILYRESDVNEQMSSDDEYVRIKIFTQEGVQRADVEIPFQKGSDSIKSIRARTILPNGTIVNFEGNPLEKEVVKASGIKILAKTFTLPDVQPGCIIEYRYRDQYNSDLFLDTSWVLQSDLFARLTRFRIRPMRTSAQLQYRAFRLPEGAEPQQQPNGDITLEVENLPGIQKEPLMPPESTLEAQVEFYYRFGSSPAGETKEQYWTRTGKGWNKDDDQFIGHKREIEEEVSRITGRSDSPEEKLRKIYAEVRQIRNFSVVSPKPTKEGKPEEIKPNRNIADVLKHGYGTSWEINLLFVGLARAAGFDARLVDVAPRDETAFYPGLEEASEINRAIAWVRAAGHEYWLDAGRRYYPFGILPWFETDTGGLRVSDAGGEIVRTPALAASDAVIQRRADLKMSPDGSLNGTAEVDFTGEAAAVRRTEYGEEDDAGRRKGLSDEIQQWLATGSKFEITEVENWDNPERPLVVKGTAGMPGFGSVAGKRLIFPEGVFRSPVTQVFRPERRANDVVFPYPYEQEDEVKIELPAGESVESLPLANQFPPESDSPVSYRLSAAKDGQAVDIKRTFTISRGGFNASAYPTLRTFFMGVESADNAQIVAANAETAQH